MVRDPRRDLLEIFSAALARVGGEAAVRRRLEADPPEGPVYLIAVGKAAAAMSLGALQALAEPPRAGLVITKHGHLDPRLQDYPGLELYESDHPLPGAASLAAGARLLDFVRDLPTESHLLVLISGGASSLVEALPAGMDLEALQRLNAWLLASGLPIGAINRVRKACSLIKGGRLAALVAPRPTLCLLISDVAGDDPAVIGSGPLAAAAESGPPPELPAPLAEWVAAAPPMPGPEDPCFRNLRLEIVADLAAAKAAAAEQARTLGYAVTLHETFLDGEAGETGRRLGEILATGAPGLHIWGGETTVRLPPEPGRGGRNQHLALAAAMALAGRDDLWLLAAGTDGTDGPTEDAGALVDGGTLSRCRQAGLDPRHCLERADAGRCLEASGDLLRTGPTGTNVMDLVIGLRSGA